jgi:uncharacterized protein YbbC (DUF1343 family)
MKKIYALSLLILPFIFTESVANIEVSRHEFPHQLISNPIPADPKPAGNIEPGAARIDLYISLLKGKSVGVFSNQTSVIGDKHLIDLLLMHGIRISKIFSPEHGFRGTADAGEKVGNMVDSATGIPLVSLYGIKRKPSAEDLRDIDVMIFDIQDVGARFYTYISSLQDYIEAAIEHDKPLLLLDRPNPNGFYVDGPVLEKKFRSFIGMQPIPVVYGMTMGEYAKMLVGEKWLDSSLMNKLTSPVQSTIGNAKHFALQVIPCGNYTHKSKYVLPVKPSPNLPDIQSVYWYPSTCFFEGTILSEGRGTEKPFQLFGHPSLPHSLISFTPRSKEGATNPKLKDQLCYGWDVSGTPQQVLARVNNRIQLKWVLNAYKLFPDKEKFFLANNFFNRLAGSDVLMKQIKEGKTESEIRKSWQPKLNEFKKIRKKYLLYPDFE